MSKKPIFYDTRDLVTIRVVSHANYNIFIKIDRENNKVSLVERDSNGAYVPKRWLFAERGLEYMNGWRNIIKAIDLAIVDAQADLEAYNEAKKNQKLKGAIDMAIAVNDERDINQQIKVALNAGHRVYSMAVGRVGEVMAVGRGGMPIEICHQSRPRKEVNKRHRHLHGATTFNSGDTVKLEKMKDYYMVVNTPWKSK